MFTCLDNDDKALKNVAPKICTWKKLFLTPSMISDSISDCLLLLTNQKGYESYE